MTIPAAAADPSHTGGAASLNHVFCCDLDFALCGADVSGDEIVDEADCVVCLDLEELPCPTCGQ